MPRRRVGRDGDFLGIIREYVFREPPRPTDGLPARKDCGLLVALLILALGAFAVLDLRRSTRRPQPKLNPRANCAVVLAAIVVVIKSTGARASR